MTLEINFEWDADSGKNLFWLASEDDAYHMGPYPSVAEAESAARAAGCACEGAGPDERSADAENGNI